MLMFLSPWLSAQQAGNEALADEFFRNRDYGKAAELYTQLYDGGRNGQYYSRLLDALLLTKRFPEAEKLITERRSADPSDPRYVLDLGNLYKKSGQAERAREQFELVLKNLPAESHLISGIAYKLYGYGEADLAIKALFAARERLGDRSAFGFELARLYYLNKQIPGTIEEMLNLADHHPEYLENIKGQLQFYLREDKDFALLREMLEKRTRRRPDQDVYRELLLWSYLQQKEFSRALELAMEGGEEETKGQRLLYLAGIALANEDYEVAAQAYKQVMDQGREGPLYQQARIRFLNARRKQVLSGKYTQEELLGLEKEYESLLQDMGKSRATAQVMQELAQLKGQYLDKVEEALSLLEETIQLVPSGPFQAECKLQLGDLYILHGDVWEATLLYGQVEKAFKDNPLGQEARFRNARLSYFIGEFEWARGQLDILKSSTSQLMANDALNLSLLISENAGADSNYSALKMYAEAELLSFRNHFREALAKLDSIPRLHPGHSLTDDILMARAGIFTRQGKLEEAAQSFSRIIEEYPQDIWADDAIFKLGELYEKQLAKPEQASALYEKILLDYPGSLYVTEARKRFRTLRGDIPAPEEALIKEPLRF